MRHMDYDKFKKEYEIFKGYNLWNEWQQDDCLDPEGVINLNEIVDRRKRLLDKYDSNNKNDMVNSPAHYTRGSQEVIDIIEDVIRDAPAVSEGYLQGQALKYLLRLWLKDNPKQDAEKAVWYLNRLISKLD